MTDVMIRDDVGSRTQRRRKRARRRFAARALVALVVAGCVAAAAWMATTDTARPGAATDRPEAQPAAPVEQETVLLAMTLSDDPSQQADSLTLFASGGTGDPVVLFIPAGTLAPIPGQGFEAVGKALAFGRPSLQHIAVENVLGASVDHTLVVDDVTIAKIVDSLGGVEIEVTERLAETNAQGRTELVFPPGVQRMSGARASIYMTYRGEGQTELDRFPRMQKVWEAVLRAIGGGASLDAALAVIEGPLVDPEASEGFARALRVLSGVSIPSIRFDVLPAMPIGPGGDADGYDLDEAAAAARVRRLLEGSLPEQAPDPAARPRVEIRNGNGTPETGERVASLLVPAGMKIEVTGNADTFDHRQTRIVVYGDGQQAAALGRRVRELLGVGTIEVGTRAQTVVDVTVVVGKDFPG